MLKDKIIVQIVFYSNIPKHLLVFLVHSSRSQYANVDGYTIAYNQSIFEFIVLYMYEVIAV